MLLFAKIFKSTALRLTILLSVFFLHQIPTIIAQEKFDLSRYSQALEKKPRFVAGLNNKRSLANGEPVRIWGIYAGMDYDEEIRFSLGLNFLSAPLIEKHIGIPAASDTTTTSTNFGYWSFGSEFTIFRNEKWKLSLPVSVGLGQVKIIETQAGEIREASFASFPLETSGAAIYYLRDWLGLKAGMGVRIALGKRGFQTFTAPFYKIGIGIYPSVLYQNLSKD